MIYFIYSESGHIKIGVTNTLGEDRLKALQIGCPYKLTLLKIIDGGFREESIIHKLFIKYHFRGEWFIFNNTIRDFINKPHYKDILPDNPISAIKTYLIIEKRTDYPDLPPIKRNFKQYYQFIRFFNLYKNDKICKYSISCYYKKLGGN
jgi:hypothetical protein